MTPSAIDEYCDNFATAQALDSRYLAGHQFWMARAGEQPVGVLEVKGPAHILMLFVIPELHRQGIARLLLGHAFPGFPTLRYPLSVNSVPNSVGAYKRFGFRQDGEEQIVGGIRFVPMTLEAALA